MHVTSVYHLSHHTWFGSTCVSHVRVVSYPIPAIPTATLPLVSYITKLLRRCGKGPDVGLVVADSSRHQQVSPVEKHAPGGESRDKSVNQTHSELFRRRLSAKGAKPDSNNRWKSDLSHVCMYVGMVFGIISRTKARSAINEVPNCRSPERALLRHHIIRGATSNQRAARETAKISSARGKNAREYWQQPTLSSEDSATNETYQKIGISNGHCLG